MCATLLSSQSFRISYFDINGQNKSFYINNIISITLYDLYKKDKSTDFWLSYIFIISIFITNNSAAIDWTTRNVVFKEILTIKNE